MQQGTGKEKALWTIALVLVVLYALVPVAWIASLSFKTTATLHDGHFIPREWTLDNYKGIFQTSEFTRALINSIGIGIITTLVAVIVGTMAAYAIARLTFPGKSLILGVSLLIAMFPQVSLVSPLFDIERKLGLFDTWPGLILPYITFRAADGHLHSCRPSSRRSRGSWRKAAQMDGATPFQRSAWWWPRWPSRASSRSDLVFIFAWNDFLLAVSLTSTEAARTAPAAMANFRGSSRVEEPTGSIAAAAIVITIPIIIFVVIFQRRIVAGLTSGAVKG